FYTGQVDSLHAHMEPEAQQAMSKDAILKRQYWRTAKFSTFDEPLIVRWVIMPTGMIGGMGLGRKAGRRRSIHDCEGLTRFAIDRRFSHWRDSAILSGEP
ncbi:MAG: hypothetical protein M3081_16640, partial [Gemmatimonadota bacterium]|nr:hypothetical protein [Gemmatimonadota bacterium]